MAESKRTADETESATAYRLYAEFAITPPKSVSCPLEEFDSEITDVKQQLVGDDCQTQTTVTGRPNESDSAIVHSKNTLDAGCHCPVFLEFDCIPHVTGISDDAIIVETYLPDRERLTGLIDGLKAVSEGVSLRRLMRADAEDSADENTVTLNLFSVTEKQREAALKAVASGYYQTPRETTISELAADLEISKSAMSQRLNAVESKLALAAFKQD